MSHRSRTTPASRKAVHSTRLAFNADAAAIFLALALATLIRLNIIHHIGW